MTKLRIALCMSGQYRTLEKCFPSLLKSIVQDCDFDLFAHFAPTSELNESFLRSNFASFKIAPDPTFDEHNFADKINPGFFPGTVQQFLAQMHSIFEANKLRREYEINQGIRYDWVFRIRSDSLYLNSLENLATLSNQYCYVPNFGSSPATPDWYAKKMRVWGFSTSRTVRRLVLLSRKLGVSTSLNDRVAFASGPIMDTYCERNLFIKQYVDDGMVFHAETSVKWHLSRCKIPVRYTQVIFNTLREDGSGDGLFYN